MNFKKLQALAFACCSSVALSGCYTVLSDPYAVSTLHEHEYERADRDGQHDRSAERDAAAEDDFYRYPGVPGSYGAYGAGYPLRGGYYGAGSYGAYPVPYGAYSSYGHYGYGPHSYGYDPYYTDSRGFYVPPGYELVSTRELDDIRASLADIQNGVPSSVDQARAREQMRDKEDVWIRRAAPQMRRPDPTPRSTSSIATPSAPSSSPSRPSAVSTSAPASKTTSGKESATPKKRRR